MFEILKQEFMKKLLLFLLCVMFLPFASWAQSQSISGTVSDAANKKPIPGVTVVVKGTTTGVITDDKGNYSLSNIPRNATLQFSFIGMKKLEIIVSGKTSINVV